MMWFFLLLVLAVLVGPLKVLGAVAKVTAFVVLLFIAAMAAVVFAGSP